MPPTTLNSEEPIIHTLRRWKNLKKMQAIPQSRLMFIKMKLRERKSHTYISQGQILII